MTDIDLSFREIRDKDKPFLEAVYASTRQEELAPLPWTDEQKQTFLKFQFQAQHQHYMTYFADARFQIILQGKIPVGRLYVDRRDDEIRIVDIALLPAYRNQGIGSHILTNLLAEGQTTGRPVRIHVEQNNPAMSLYQRLGFVKINEEGVYWLMEWSAERIPSKDEN